MKLDDLRKGKNQICTADYFLHRNRITHTDLKPKNVCLKDKHATSRHKYEIRAIDFGSATIEKQRNGQIYGSGRNSLKLQDLRNVGHQICSAVNFLHRNKITHTDLKPENICVKEPQATRCQNLEIRLIDFGNATEEKQPHGQVIQTLQYRAPEVSLGIGWDETADHSQSAVLSLN